MGAPVARLGDVEGLALGAEGLDDRHLQGGVQLAQVATSNDCTKTAAPAR